MNESNILRFKKITREYVHQFVIILKSVHLNFCLH